MKKIAHQFFCLTLFGVWLVSCKSKESADAPPAPPLIEKLQLVKLDSTVIKIAYNSDMGTGIPQPGELHRFEQATVQDGKVVRANSKYLAPDNNIFDDGAGANRFHLKRVERKKTQLPRGGAPRELNIATIEDKSANKAGQTYEVPKGSANAILVQDYVATFRFNTPQEGESVLTVAEGDTFTLGEELVGEPVPYKFVDSR